MDSTAEKDVSERMQVMIDSLSEHRLEIDMKNEIVLQFIFLGEGAMFTNPINIARFLAEQKFLVEFCDIRAGYRLAKNQCSGIRLSPPLWRQRVISCILLTKDATSFPDTWPWIQSTPEKRNPVNESITSALYFGKNRHSTRKSRPFMRQVPRRVSEIRCSRHPI
jgi:hypothetical protein